MKTPMFAAVAALFATAALPTFAFADGNLPDLEGREIVIATEKRLPAAAIYGQRRQRGRLGI